MADEKCEVCGWIALWWMTGFGVEPHARCDECKDELVLSKGANAQPLSAFESRPTVASGQCYSEGKGVC